MCGRCGCEMGHHECDCHHARRFFTKEEKIKRLKSYIEDLKKEIAAVQEHVKELESQ
jgi:ribosomal protein S15P/S13E